MHTLVAVAIFTNLVTGVSISFEVENAPCGDIIQQSAVVRSYGDDVFRGDAWTVVCVEKEK